MEIQGVNTGGLAGQALHLPNLPLSPPPPTALHTAGDPWPSCSWGSCVCRVRKELAETLGIVTPAPGVTRRDCQLWATGSACPSQEQGFAFLCKHSVHPGRWGGCLSVAGAPQG